MPDQSEQVVIKSFSTGSLFVNMGCDVKSTSDVLREVADWLEAEPSRVLINACSVGFGEPDEIVIQVVATEVTDA